MPRTRAYLVLGIGAALVVVVLLLLTAPTPARTRAPIDGCTQVQPTELWVQQQWVCADGSEVLTFKDVTQRDNYTEVATQYGVMIIDRGEAWIRLKRV